MTYTINGKEYSERNIIKRCAELMGFKVVQRSMVNEGNIFVIDMSDHLGESYRRIPEYGIKPSETWPIIEKVFDDLMAASYVGYETKWEYLIERHKCDKLTAACVCLIESNGG